MTHIDPSWQQYRQDFYVLKNAGWQRLGWMWVKIKPGKTPTSKYFNIPLGIQARVFWKSPYDGNKYTQTNALKVERTKI